MLDARERLALLAQVQGQRRLGGDEAARAHGPGAADDDAVAPLPLVEQRERQPRRVEGLVHRPADEARDAVEVEHRRHGAGEPLDGALDVEALAEEDPVHHALGADVDGVEEQHDGERQHHGRGERARAHPEPGEDHVEQRDGPGVGRDHDTGHQPVDGAEADDGAHVEEVVAHHGVGHGQGEEDVELPEQGQVRHRHARHGLEGRAHHGSELAHGEPREQHPGALAAESAVEPRSAVVASAAIRRTRDETQYTAAAVGISTSSLGGTPVWRVWRRTARSAETPYASQMTRGWRRDHGRRSGKLCARCR